ncbi:M20/M25/M40 family metallo-hydrolase [Leptospira sp. 2 VSF19]|uniref:M20/M25/M40 family metallo-hydrolase n=1 Tax=Leptospira soteropolitanensis TaxID=2950025 RepID=A0AAW5V995_9LEPT|nr:M20/M25/M40 family metallo-hydrolase [Leptospira soteropolitanensis]MCW7491440.1 M20/M25/M40 family metallo-hydrolase [Leptospira soteropolitanensis]MCW7499024.1 M20/M25/M40 family metallo-hydrolase [Leptospira soteropolitanensis]MCW7521384.1 M20/M25/M40 family metallo-hydrolase [Leptospira soteropolitanensis]MCW7525128.1 M20/M25/M40 family metallo-hydrolase [Leptospira soteropolitanensis]MCW7528995.1 M20/M25/M40 family metallo-hydrolase [Leptospira soteropolitanensis]
MKFFISFLMGIGFLLQCSFGQKVKYAELKQSYPKVNWEARRTEAVKLLSDLLKIPSVRGNEIQVAKYIQGILTKEEIPSRFVYDPKYPTRPNLIAELPATVPNPEPGIILANHLDTVEFDPREWKMAPLSGTVNDGRVWGRGAIDMKGMAVMELLAFLEIKRSGIPRTRKIMYLALADEESGSELGGKYMTSKQKQVFEGYEYAINEGGVATRDIVIPGSTIFNIQYAEKGNIWLRAKIKGTSGHGSSPPTQYPALSLIQFFNEVRELESDIRITEETDAFFYQLGTISSFPKSFFLKNARNPIIKPLLHGTIRSNRHLTAMTTNTKSITGFRTTEGEGGENVIAGEASGRLDIRTLPGVNIEEFANQVKTIAAKYNAEITFTDINPTDVSPINTRFFSTLAAVSVNKFPNSTVTPFLSPGKTDNSYLRRVGIKAYGLIPAVLKSEDIDGMHGKNENMTVDNLELGTKILFETLVEMNR